MMTVLSEWKAELDLLQLQCDILEQKESMLANQREKLQPLQLQDEAQTKRLERLERRSDTFFLLFHSLCNNFKPRDEVIAELQAEKEVRQKKLGDATREMEETKDFVQSLKSVPQLLKAAKIEFAHLFQETKEFMLRNGPEDVIAALKSSSDRQERLGNEICALHETITLGKTVLSNLQIVVSCLNTAKHFGTNGGRRTHMTRARSMGVVAKRNIAKFNSNLGNLGEMTQSNLRDMNNGISRQADFFSIVSSQKSWRKVIFDVKAVLRQIEDRLQQAQNDHVQAEAAANALVVSYSVN